MTNYSMNSPQLWLDFEEFSPEAISLGAEQIEQAVELSSQIPSEARQWQTYLNALALFAFEQWLEERSAELSINREDCTIFQPATANAIEAVGNLQVNQFRLCLITTGSFTDEEVTLPRAVVELPEFIPHFYVLVEVQEEQESAVIYGFLSYQQLMERQATAELATEEDWTYQLPLNWFEADPDRLLLYLRCLEPSAISLPAVPNNRLATVSSTQHELTSLLPQLQAGDRQLWQVLSWQQGAAVLASPELLSWVYQAQTQKHSPVPNLHLSDLLQLVTQPAVNVGRWLRDELDGLAQELSWALLPNIAPAAMRSVTEIRSPVEEFEAIATQLYARGLEIPSQSRGAYRDVLLAGIPLRLYAVTWSLPSELDSHSWTLLLILDAPFGETLPYGLKLRVSDQTGVLVEQQLNSESGDSYLFTRVVGSWDEKFLVSISLTNGIELTLPPFAFHAG